MRKYSMTATIHFCNDKDGKPYSAEENNPKNRGSGAREKFSLYREGMTVAQAVDGGIKTRDLDYDLSKGFIRLEAGEDAEDEESAA